MSISLMVNGKSFPAVRIEDRFVLCLPDSEFPEGTDAKVVIYSSKKVGDVLKALEVKCPR